MLLTVPVVLGVATLVFSLIHLVPGDPVQAMLGESASPADMAELRAKLGLDRPLIVQYGGFLQGLAVGDLGTSLRTNQPVAAAIAERMPATFELGAGGHGARHRCSPCRSASSRRCVPARPSITRRRRSR